MGFLSSKIIINKAKLNKLSQTAVKSLEMTGDQLLTNLKSSQTMPKDTGNLQNESTSVDYSNSRQGSVTISSSTPYARRLYYHPEYNFNKSDNSRAGGKWFDPYLKGGSKQDMAKRLFMNIYKRNNNL